MNAVRHFEEIKARGLPIRTVNEAFDLFEKEYDLTFTAWSFFELSVTDSLAEYRL